MWLSTASGQPVKYELVGRDRIELTWSGSYLVGNREGAQGYQWHDSELLGLEALE